MPNVELAANLFGLFTLAATGIGITWMLVSAVRGELKRKRP